MGNNTKLSTEFGQYIEFTNSYDYNILRLLVSTPFYVKKVEHIYNMEKQMIQNDTDHFFGHTTPCYQIFVPSLTVFSFTATSSIAAR
jgi:hypothetical protein